MTAIGFYHLTRSTLTEALPQLLVRTLAARQRALVLAVQSEALMALSQALWAHKAWLPHGTEADGDAPLQPIWLSATPAAPNDARYLFLTGGTEIGDIGAFERVFDLFDGNDDGAVNAARQRWRAAKQLGHDLTYWQQTDGLWQKKA